MTGRILKVAREQQEEVDAETQQEVLHTALGSAAGAQLLSSGALAAALRRTADSSDDEDDSDGPGPVPRRMSRDDSDAEGDADDAELRARTLSSLGASTRGAGSDADRGAGSLMYEAAEEEEVSPEDEAALAAFMAPNSSTYKQASLGDLIVSKLKERQAQEGIEVMAE